MSDEIREPGAVEPNRPPPADGGRQPLLVVLAAGGGSRYQGPTHKLNARLDSADDGTTVAERSIANALAADVGDLVVVVGATAIDRLASVTIEPDSAGARPGRGLTVLENPDWAAGQATSLATAIRFARDHGYGAVVVGLADQPFIEPDAWRRVAASAAPIAFATYDGRQGHPVRLGAEVWDQLPTTGDEGARSIVRLRRREAEAVACSGSAADIDTVEDLTSWQNHSSTNSPSTVRSRRHGR